MNNAISICSDRTVGSEHYPIPNIANSCVLECQALAIAGGREHFCCSQFVSESQKGCID